MISRSRITGRALAIRFLGALVIWTLLSYGFISMFSGSNVCTILQPVGAGASPHPLTQAEMDAQTARCNRPNMTTVGIALAGYAIIGGVAFVSVLDSAERDTPQVGGDR